MASRFCNFPLHHPTNDTRPSIVAGFKSQPGVYSSSPSPSTSTRPLNCTASVGQAVVFGCLLTLYPLSAINSQDGCPQVRRRTPEEEAVGCASLPSPSPLLGSMLNTICSYPSMPDTKRRILYHTTQLVSEVYIQISRAHGVTWMDEWMMIQMTRMWTQFSHPCVRSCLCYTLVEH